MADRDYSRRVDLIELTQAIRNARSHAEKEALEKVMHRIVNESTQVRSLRNELLDAIRHNDRGKVKRVQAHLHSIRLNETAGTSWGNDKGERKIYD